MNQEMQTTGKDQSSTSERVDRQFHAQHVSKLDTRDFAQELGLIEQIPTNQYGEYRNEWRSPSNSEIESLVRNLKRGWSDLGIVDLDLEIKGLEGILDSGDQKVHKLEHLLDAHEQSKLPRDVFCWALLELFQSGFLGASRVSGQLEEKGTLTLSLKEWRGYGESYMETLKPDAPPFRGAKLLEDPKERFDDVTFGVVGGIDGSPRYVIRAEAVKLSVDARLTSSVELVFVWRQELNKFNVRSDAKWDDLSSNQRDILVFLYEKEAFSRDATLTRSEVCKGASGSKEVTTYSANLLKDLQSKGLTVMKRGTGGGVFMTNNGRKAGEYFSCWK